MRLRNRRETSRAIVWHAEDGGWGPTHFRSKTLPKVAMRWRSLQVLAYKNPHARDENGRYSTRFLAAIRAWESGARRETVKVAQHGPELRPDLTPDSMQQK